MANIELKTKIINDKYTEYVYEAFDIQNREETSVSIPMNLGEAKNFDWNIGVILGGSGSGKTTILKKMGDVKKANFDAEKPLIGNFDWLEPKDATLVLTSMGLSSVPTWLRPFHTLSNGEQYRATLAYLVASAKEGEVILVDEYTSVVDRDVAKAMSFALQKYIRRENKRIIVASCHYDILEWLMPDWTCSPQKGGVLERCDYLRQGRPQITLQVSRVEPNTWDFFKKHHYLTEEVNKSCQCILFEWNKKPIAICCILNTPRKGMGEAMAISRIVVNPDYQGMGIGYSLCSFIGGIYKQRGNRIFIKTVNPSLGIKFNNSKEWRGTTFNGKKAPHVNLDAKAKNRFDRISYCHEYIGEAIDGYEDLLLPINEMRSKNEITLF
jgi:energy-coupling factor transporter ATP-binding protein EcfA2/GNAT superfamily N-acetyltransferase